MCKLVEIKMGVYRHFKGNDYEVFDIAEHSETGETLIIYRSINRKRYCDNGIVYARPMDMFFSKVDKEKYPEATQNDRFEYIGTNNETSKLINSYFVIKEHPCGEEKNKISKQLLEELEKRI